MLGEQRLKSWSGASQGLALLERMVASLLGEGAVQREGGEAGPLRIGLEAVERGLGEAGAAEEAGAPGSRNGFSFRAPFTTQASPPARDFN